MAAVVGVLALVIAYYATVKHAFGGPDSASSFGDSFGGLNAIVSSVTLLLLAFSVILQRRDLAVQIKEMAASVRAQEQQARVTERQLDHLQATARDEAQRRRLERQPLFQFIGFDDGSLADTGEFGLLAHQGSALNLTVSLHRVLDVGVGTQKRAWSNRLAEPSWVGTTELLPRGQQRTWNLSGIEDKASGLGAVLCVLYEDERRESTYRPSGYFTQVRVSR